jgi:2-isopropylmalate synthase
MDAQCGRCENGNPCSGDFVRRSLDHFHQLTEQCVRQNVSRIVVCDTNGGASPEEVAHVFEQLRQNFPGAGFGFHGHTDRGLGVANTRAAIMAGAVQVQGTLIGTGERCGNVNLTTVVGAMQLRGEVEFITPEALTGLTGLAQSAYAAFALDPPHGAPIVGPGAFGTWAGMHGSSERKNPGAYLWCDPARVGASPVIGVNAQSGKANIMLLAESMGLPLNSAQAQTLLEKNAAMIEGGGFTASEVSFRLACMRTLGTLPNWFTVRSWRIFDECDDVGDHYALAFMTLMLGDAKVATTRAEGAGPVDALTKAMRRELEKPFPSLADMHLGTFTVTALDVKAYDSAAHVRVAVSFNSDGHDPWTTAGVSSDLNQAALMAIVDGFHYWLLMQPGEPSGATGVTAAPVSTEVA